MNELISIEIIVLTQDDDTSIGSAYKKYVPREGETLWMPYGAFDESMFNTRAFKVVSVAHHISLTLEGYDNVVLYVEPITE